MAEAMLELEEPIPAEMNREAGNGLPEKRIFFVWGDDDKIFHLEIAHKLTEQLGEKAKLQYIEKAGHLAQLERPCVYNAHLKQILASLTTDKQL
ncbi:hypothetical protein CK203_069668 [Vitis vinifera]|uniref:AB hydrolase-1 domain-containing protein n=1 Tax=Vitis vinifera TaxID=29760 RepID=A0A438EKU4_VITVI|nr:hypothetical protein CK203_069668 [Vitis vinifera]